MAEKGRAGSRVAEVVCDRARRREGALASLVGRPIMSSIEAGGSAELTKVQNCTLGLSDPKAFILKR